MPRATTPAGKARHNVYQRARRARLRMQRQREAVEHARARAIWVTRRMSAASPAEIEWRVLVLTSPDARSLTARLMGDPRPGRSALDMRRFFGRLGVAA